MTSELWRCAAADLAAGIRRGEFSSREVITAHLERIEAVNGKLGAVTVTLADSALAAADRADSSSPTGPLHGVPFTIKENIDCIGSATTDGLPALEHAIPTVDSPTVERLKAAGAIPLARTNLPEMGLRITTENPLRGRTCNPWTNERTAGGSSGGEGSAIASGMSPLGLGNDIGGSLRNPAFCCGITSLKPSRGRIPKARSIPPADVTGLADHIMAVEGPMARHVRDVRLAYRLLSGRHQRDPNSVDAPLFGPPPAQRRAGLVTSVPGVILPAQQVTAIRAAGEALLDAGWTVEEVTPPELDRVNEIWGRLLAMDLAPVMQDMAGVMSPQALGIIEGLCELYEPALPLPTVHGERWRLANAWTRFFEDCPVVIGPTWTDIPFLHDSDISAGGVEMTVNMLRFITPANLLGLPAVPVPTGIHEGLPTGVQVVADIWQDALVLDIAETIETACGQITPIDPAF